MDTIDRLPLGLHTRSPWRVHALAPDFELLDVWRFSVHGGPDDFPAFVAMMGDLPAITAQMGWAARALFALRKRLGEWFGWDRPGPIRVIPGAHEPSVAARLPRAERRAPRPAGTEFTPVYATPREALSEISNETVHALMHLGWVEREPGVWSPEMAVYVKHRGRLGHVYMALIGPFRHFVVYPALGSAVAKCWASRRGAESRATTATTLGR